MQMYQLPIVFSLYMMGEKQCKNNTNEQEYAKILL